MACEDLVVGCFLDDRAPLAVPELNRERTLKYLECCYKQGSHKNKRRATVRSGPQSTSLAPEASNVVTMLLMKKRSKGALRQAAG